MDEQSRQKLLNHERGLEFHDHKIDVLSCLSQMELDLKKLKSRCTELETRCGPTEEDITEATQVR